MAILVSTPQDLNNIRNNLSGDYELTNDIDMSTWGNWTPIGNNASRFTGAINGKGYKISNLTINSTVENTGFIGATGSGSSISNLGLDNVNVTCNQSTVGGLVGLNYMATVSNCYVTGTINVSGSKKYYTGGLIGRHYGTMDSCFSRCDVTGVNGVGGLVGQFASNVFVSNCYSCSKVSGVSDIGGFYGSGSGIFTNNYFDKDVAGTTNFQTTGVTAKTTTEMQTQSTFTGWDFDTVWYMDEYPKLRVFLDIPTAKKETVSVESYSLPFFSNLGKSQKSTKQLQSYAISIQANTERHTTTLRNVEGYLSQINSNVTQSHRSVKTGNRNGDSFVLPISSNISRESKTIKQLLSFIKPLQTHISVLHPIIDIPVYAVVSTQENHSMTSNEQNMSEISYKKKLLRCLK